MKRAFLTLVLGFLAGIGGAWTYATWLQQPLSHQAPERFASQYNPQEEPLAVETAPIRRSVPPDNTPDDFNLASQNSTASVVYIRTVSTRYGSRSWFDLFFDGNWQSQQVSSGSGVIYTEDGYIITNNHVINGADAIEVIHGKNSYAAELIGTDPNTDLAVLKVDARDLPAIQVASSKEVEVGDWVLAVGNPFNLTSTVTAGIVSAKGRQINVLKGRFPIESFIQTDAAINPGNSGGALVNTKGQLVGINTAILSQTGSYAGYGFAVPVDIVRKVTDDLIRYGDVQKAILGAEVIDLNQQVAQKYQLPTDQLDGVLVQKVYTNSAAGQAGLKPGDIIFRINDTPVNTSGTFDELLSYQSPGDKITVHYRRERKEEEVTLTLTNRAGTTELLIRETYEASSLGVIFESIPSAELSSMNLKAGIRVGKVKNGFFKKLGIPEGFIITSVNNRLMTDPAELTELLEKLKGKVIIRGVNEKGMGGYYSYVF